MHGRWYKMLDIFFFFSKDTFSWKFSWIMDILQGSSGFLPDITLKLYRIRGDIRILPRWALIWLEFQSKFWEPILRPLYLSEGCNKHNVEQINKLIMLKRQVYFDLKIYFFLKMFCVGPKDSTELYCRAV